jgi:hypothetical protein
MYNTNLASFYNASTLLSNCVLCVCHMTNAKYTIVERIVLRIENNRTQQGTH